MVIQFTKMKSQYNLEDAQEYEYLKEYAGHDKEYMVNYFMKIKDKVNLEELRGGFY